MQAFHNDPQIKLNIIAEMEAHALADEIVQGRYWENGKGCLVGCAVHGRNHALFETRYGIPRTIAYLADRIFEGLPNAEAKEFPLHFWRSIRIGKDLSLVTAKFTLRLLDDPDKGVIHLAKTDRTRKSTQGVIDLYKKLLAGNPPTTEEWDATAAAAAAYAAAAYAAAAAAYAAAAYAAAAYAAARSNYYRFMRDALLQLLSEAPVTEPTPEDKVTAE